MATTSHKAWTAGLGSSAGILLFALVARLTGLVAMPEASLVEEAVAALGAAAVGGIVNFALTWLVPNRPKPEPPAAS